jgi:hypothetical protein
MEAPYQGVALAMPKAAPAMLARRERRNDIAADAA